MRALRRYHKKRFKEIARKRFPWHSRAFQLGDNMKTCSKPRCCGNPRRMGRVTKQELYSFLNLRDQCDELGLNVQIRARRPKYGW